MAALRPQGGQFRASTEAPVDTLATKLARPRVPPTYIARTHLNALLDEGTKRPLTVVSAGAGWGKTLATAAWAGSEPGVGPVAWISLDPSDNEPGAFWTSFVAALRGALDLPRDNPIVDLAPGLSQEAGLQRVQAGIEQLSAPVVVVLDDFHLIDAPSVLSGLASLLRHPPEQLHLVIVTRADPALPLHRLRVSDELFEIRSRDLAFDETDAAAMFAADDVAVSPEDVRMLLQRTEGWPAGMRLATLYLGRGDPERGPATFAGDDQAVTDYLVGEVLASQPPDVQRFLLRTSVAERLSSGLAEALTDETRGQHHLEVLESSNAFVVGLGPGREWFRYHALLREVLHHRLTVEDPEGVPDLHRRAAHWFAEHGHPVEAMRHAADAEDWDLLADLFVTRAATLILSADRAAVERELARIPRERLDDGVNLMVCAAVRLFYAGRYADMEPHLERAQRELATLEEGAHPETRVACLLLTTAVLRGRGDIEGVRRTATQAIEELSGPGDSLPGAVDYRAVALGNVGTALLWQGRMDEAERILIEGLAAAKGRQLDAARINTLSHLALVTTLSGRLGTGFDYAREAVDLVEARGWAPLSQAASAYLALALIHFRRDEITDAQRHLEHGEAAAEREATARWAMTVTGARMDAALGRLASARDRMTALTRDLHGQQPPALVDSWHTLAVAEIDLAAGDPEPASQLIERVRDRQPLSAAEQVCAARALLARGEPQQADDVLAPARERAEHGVAVEAWLLTALAADRLREDNHATEAMRRATVVAAEEGVRRPFLELYPERVARLLTMLRQLDPGTGAFVEEVLDELRPRLADAAHNLLAETLTERELIVLRFLPTMMTNAEIAGELFVSVNTVKAHLKRIYRKLDVLSRREAVHRARELGLLSDTPV